MWVIFITPRGVWKRFVLPLMVSVYCEALSETGAASRQNSVIPSSLISTRLYGPPSPVRSALVKSIAGELVRECAAQAARIVFGRIPVEFPVSVAVVESYADAK